MLSFCTSSTLCLSQLQTMISPGEKMTRECRWSHRGKVYLINLWLIVTNRSFIVDVGHWVRHPGITNVLMESRRWSLHKKVTYKNVIFPGHNHLLTINIDDPALWLFPEHQWVKGQSVPVVSRQLWPGNRTFLEVASMVVTWWIEGFLRS